MDSIDYADSHCHLNYPGLVEIQDDVITRMHKNNIKYALNVCTKLEEFDKIYETVSQHDFLYASVGIHPDTTKNSEATVKKLCEIGNKKKVVAIGETGLDYFRKVGENLDWQRERFKIHIRAARELKKPLIIHMREATEDTLKILKEEKAVDCGGVMHCFTESLEVAKRAIDLNFLISISGIVTFKKAEQVQKVAANLPIESLMVETDSPFLAPVPYRGKLNEPSHVSRVVEKISNLRDESEQYIADKTLLNFKQFVKVA